MNEKPELPESLSIKTGESTKLRYGENKTQGANAAPVLDSDGNPIKGVLSWPQSGGGKLSYNNLKEMMEGYGAGIGFEDRYTVFLLKHGRPCSGAWTKEKGVTMKDVFELARASKHKADFGNVMRVLGGTVDKEFAEGVVKDKKTKIFTEVMLADSYTEDALKILKAAYAEEKKIRIYQFTEKPEMSYEAFIKYGAAVWQDVPKFKKLNEEEISRPVPKDVMKKYLDLKTRKAEKMKVTGIVTEEHPSPQTIKGLIAADELVEKVHSNGAIFVNCEYGRDDQGKPEVRTCWIEGAATEESRVEAIFMAKIRAGERAKRSLLSLDGSSPFRDNIDEVSDLDLAGIIQPGGSRKDKEVIEACNEYGIPMIFSGVRRFKH